MLIIDLLTWLAVLIWLGLSFRAERRERGGPANKLKSLQKTIKGINQQGVNIMGAIKRELEDSYQQTLELVEELKGIREGIKARREEIERSRRRAEEEERGIEEVVEKVKEEIKRE